MTMLASTVFNYLCHVDKSEGLISSSPTSAAPCCSIFKFDCELHDALETVTHV